MNKPSITLKTLYLISACIFMLISCNDAKPTLDIPEGKVGLIGYGSLTSAEQMESQLGKSYEGSVEVVHLEGYQRTWDATTPNKLEFPPVGVVMDCIYQEDTILPRMFSVLNIHKNEAVAINCCLFIIDEGDLDPIDATEIGYKRIDVTNNIAEYDINKGTVWAYQAEKKYTKTPDPDSVQTYVLPKMYLGFLEAGFKELGTEYEKEFYETTLPIPQENVLDCSMVSNQGG